MKWSKEKDKAFEKVVNHIIQVIEDKTASEELPKWVVNQVEKRINKINYYYDNAKKDGFKGVALIITSLLIMPISMLCGVEESVFLIGALTTIMGLASSERYFEDRKLWQKDAENSEKDLLRWVYGMEDPEVGDTGQIPMPEGYFNKEEMPEDVKESFGKCMEYFEM